MKSLLIGLLLFAGIGAQAQCLQIEAQVIANTKKIIAEDAQTCTVTLDFSRKNAQLNPSYVCPLTDGDISNGVTLIKTQGECPTQSGDLITGVIFKSLVNADPKIYLE